jgi:hypothetical protein
MANDIFDSMGQAFAVELDRLMQADPKDKELFEAEIARAEQVSVLGSVMVRNASTKLDAIKTFESMGHDAGALAYQRAKMLGDGDGA